jgi:NTP pyrophosphatase (non-canonical NTP hydrolase)
MNPKEYQKRALQTAQFPPEQALAYLTLGLCGEVAELIEKYQCQGQGAPLTEEDVIGELGDVCWYCAVLANLFGIELGELGNEQWAAGSSDQLVIHAGLIANKAKKTIRDGTPMNPEFVREQIELILRAVAGEAELIGDSTLAEVMRLNIEKLECRMARGVIAGSGDQR